MSRAGRSRRGRRRLAGDGRSQGSAVSRWSSRWRRAASALAAPAIEVEPAEALEGQRVVVRLVGLAPGRPVTLHAARLFDRYPTGQEAYRGRATFIAGADGRIDTARDAPTAESSYAGVDPAGLFWSMAPLRRAPTRASDPAGLTDPTTLAPGDVLLELESEGRIVARARAWLAIAAADVAVHEVREGGVVGVHAAPAGTARRPAVIVLGGSEGGLFTVRSMAPLLASHGYAVLGLGYFRGARARPLEHSRPRSKTSRSKCWKRAVAGCSRSRVSPPTDWRSSACPRERSWHCSAPPRMPGSMPWRRSRPATWCGKGFRPRRRRAASARPSAHGDTTLALQATDLQVAENDFVTILGPSGCGKSTLLRIVAGLDHPTAGEVLLDGNRIVGPGADRGMVFQSYTLFPWLSVLENVCFGLRERGLPRAEQLEVANGFIAKVGLRGFESHFPKQLSGGMQQRTAIARALANGPRILLMDEPFGALDHQTRELMQELLLGIWEAEKKTVLFVTHDIDEAVFMGSRVVVMSARPGRIKLDRPVPIPHPRHYSVKTTAAFSELKAELMEQVRVEVRAAQAAVA